MTKIPTFSNIQIFMHFLSEFLTNFVDRNLKRVNKETICSPVGFSEKFISVFLVKMSQIDTGNDKNHKTFHF